MTGVIIPGKKLEAIRDIIFEQKEELTDMVNKALGECLNHIKSRPSIVCLCGSARFVNAFRHQNFLQTVAGHIVLSIGCDMKYPPDYFAAIQEDRRAEIKEDLDELHLCKIDLADWIYVLNVGGYIGESTEREIAYAMYLGKKVIYLEDKDA